jgi:excisionase family DNA binding protein
MQNDPLLTPREASRHLGVTVTTLSQWARSGRLPATYTPGGHRRYRLADLQTLQTGM